MTLTATIIVNWCSMYLRSLEACVLLCAISWCGMWSLVFEVRAWSSQSARRCWVCLQWTSSVMAGTLMYFWVWAPLEISDCPWLWAVMVMLAELIVRPIVCSLSMMVWILGWYQVSLMADSIQKYLESMNIFLGDDTPVTRPSEPEDGTPVPSECMCSICHDEKHLTHNLYVCIECHQTFHKTCIDNWKQRRSTCPLCISTQDMIALRW